MVDEIVLLNHSLEDRLLLGVLSLGGGGHAGEEIRKKREEEGHILRHQLRQVHVTDGTVHEEVLGQVEVVALGRSHGTEHRQNITKSPIVVALVGELLLTGRVQREELRRQDVEVGVSDGAHLHLLDDLEVRSHHRNTTEERLEVLRELLPSSVSGVHGDEEGTDGLKEDVLRVSGELEVLNALLLSVLDREHLLGDDGKHGKRDTVELIEASPESSLAESLEDLGAIGVLHLVGAVLHHNADAERVAQILGRLGLSSSSRTGGGTSEEHTERLGEGDVTLVGKGCNHETLLTAKVLVLVVEVDVGDGNDASTVVANIISGIGPPVETGLLQPVEVVGVGNLLLLDEDSQLIGNVTLVDVNRNQRLYLLPVDLRAEVLQTPAGHLR
mmetsp:Transcript_6230/g.12946  ORF Transcript_6230/g.12946 Transcript_6230/m.12946 type:complete len:386 (+) Transcript_6230:7525-8682(+)